jgi:hypothetical protein
VHCADHMREMGIRKNGNNDAGINDLGRESLLTTKVVTFHVMFKAKQHRLVFVFAVIWMAVDAYKRKPCTRSVRTQFQFPDCYAPDLDPSQLLSSASFLMSHDSATGYLRKGFPSSAISLYAKNQIGTAYQQLNDGARALDLRPKLLQNGTVVLQHGVVTIPITLKVLVSDAIRWCNENQDELVLLFHSNLKYEFDNVTNDGGATAVAALSAVYKNLGVAYVECDDINGITVQEAMEMAVLPGGGYLLALDRHDFYASFCGKTNWVSNQLVTCYPNGTLPCTNQNSVVFEDLQTYMRASSNNEATDDSNQLGPPASLDKYPFSEIQGLWQVTTRSAAVGVSHLSSVIDDNTKSRINWKLVNMVHDEEFRSISLLAVDHVQLNGNALFSVLRNVCGQSDLREECGSAISKPRMKHKHLSTLSTIALVAVYVAFFVWLAVAARHYRRYYQHEQQMKRIEEDLKATENQLRTIFTGRFV